MIKKTAALLVLALAALSCSEKELELADKEEFRLKECPVSSIAVTPEHVYGEECVLDGAPCEVTFTATPLDQSGNEVDAPLTWSLRYPEVGVETCCAGHQLVDQGDNRAVFVGSGRADGTFAVLVEDRSCNMGDDEYPQYPKGQAWVKVSLPADARVDCGRLRVTYGDEVDRMGDTVIASVKVTLYAEVSTREKFDRLKHRVQFYVNGEPYITTRPLYISSEMEPESGMEYAYFAFLPMYLFPGEYQVSYDLLEDGEVVCGSWTEGFKAR